MTIYKKEKLLIFNILSKKNTNWKVSFIILKIGKNTRIFIEKYGKKTGWFNL